jgi:hypothetical protein
LTIRRTSADEAADDRQQATDDVQKLCDKAGEHVPYPRISIMNTLTCQKARASVAVNHENPPEHGGTSAHGHSPF